MSKRLAAGAGLVVLAMGMIGLGLIPAVPEAARVVLFGQAPALLLLGVGLLGVRQHQEQQTAKLAAVEQKVDSTFAAANLAAAESAQTNTTLQAAGVPPPGGGK